MIELLRGVNLTCAGKNDLSDLSYELFVHFLVQLSMHLFNAKAPRDSVEALVKQFEQAVSHRNHSTQLYSDPRGLQTLSAEQQEMITKLEANLRVNPHVLMPQGYQVVKEVQ